MFNIPVVLGAALIPTIVGFIWYNPKVMGEAWMKAAEMTEEMIDVMTEEMIVETTGEKGGKTIVHLKGTKVRLG